MRYVTSFVTGILLFTFSALSSQTSLTTELDKNFRAYSVDVISTQELVTQTKGEHDFHYLTLKLGDEMYELELWNSGLNENVNITLASGKEYKGTHPTPLKGQIVDNNVSSVRLTVNDGFLSGYIKTNDQRLNVQPAYYYDTKADRNLIVTYYEKDIIEHGNSHTCGVNKNHQIHEHEIKEESITTKSTGLCFEVEIALAADWLMFQDYGSESAVENQITAVLNDVQGNYDDEFADVIEYDLSDVFISDCNTCDPWTSSTDSGDLLDDFSSWAPSNLGGHQVASLWTSRNFNGSTIGLAWVGTVCTSLSYNVLEDFTNNSSFLRVLQAHELGHNWNAFHDSGNSFIMSESVNGSNTWSSASKTSIENYLTNTSGCYNTCSSGIPPEADFEYDIIEECVVGEVEFTDLSSGAASWLWTFEGGSPGTSTDQNPTVEYFVAGVYDVTLEVTNAAGDDEIEFTNEIVITAGPVAFFETENYELEVDFLDDSGAGNSATYSWDFGDGNIGTGSTTTHEYSQPGTYSVTLEVEDDCGSDEVTMSVEVFDSPLVDFSADTLVICVNDTVQYTDMSYGGIQSWEWNFYGGVANDLTSQNPFVYYTSPGFYDVRLKVTNPEGSDSETKDAYINVLPSPTSAYSYSVNSNQVTFTNNSQNASTYLWSFGDGTTSTDTSTVHTYTSSGEYQVILQASNLCSTAADTQSVSIALEPVAEFSTTTTPQGCANLPLTFVDNSLGNPTSWNWSFPGGTPSSSTLQSPSVMYNEYGNYSVTLVVTNALGSNTIVKNDFVSVDDLPELSTSYTQNMLIVDFASSVVNGSAVSWNFGDGNSSTLPNPTHTYSSPGIYNVAATSSNACGTSSENITVSVNSLPVANFSSTASSICVPETVSFTDNSTGSIISHEWLFPGGSPASATGADATVSYNTTGEYPVTLIVTNSVGTDTLVRTNYITASDVPELAAFFTRNILTVNFLSTLNNGTGVMWDFGDGNTSTLADPIHTYATEGNYTATVTSSNNCGTVTESLTISVSSLPFAAFSANSTSICMNESVQFSDNSTGTIASREWLFPGGLPSSSTEQNPLVTYGTAGSYPVTLIVSNNAGNDTITFQDYIEVNTVPTAAYNLDQQANQIGVTATGTNTTAVTWMVSDGSTYTGNSFQHLFNENGSYTVTMFASNNCGTDETSFNVFVDAYPHSSFTSTTAAGCAPLFVTYSNPASSADTYLWTFPGGNPATSTESNPVIEYTTEGSYSVGLEVSNAFGSSSTTLDNYTTVSSAPSLNYNFDVNDNQLILNSTSVATSTTWLIDGEEISSDPSYVHTFISNGNYIITLLISNPCGSEEESFEVEIVAYPEPSFESDLTVGCVPFIVAFQNNSQNADSYVWYFPGGTPATSTEINPIVVYNEVGVFDVEIESSNALGTVSTGENNMISVADVPAVDFEISQDEEIIDLTNNSIGATSFSWDFGDGNTSEENSPSHSYTASGSYIVTLEATNECGTNQTSLTVEIDIPSSTNELAGIVNWSITPNPSNGEVTLHHDLVSTTEWYYQVMNIEGKVLFEKKINHLTQKEHVLIEEAGVYIITLSNGAKRDIKRLVVFR